MGDNNQQLLDYIKEQVSSGIPTEQLKKILLANEWQEKTINDAFSILGINTQSQPAPIVNSALTKNNAIVTENIANSSSFEAENITMDKIIEKFIPIAGALLLIIGFGYLIYANAWVNLSMEIRIGLGFFFSLVIIGGSFSLSEKMRYFTDIGVGSGVLLLYGTLIYGSRTTEIATAVIPEIMSLLTAVIFTIAVSYFASKRKSKVILILGMVGAYITPFVIGQNDVWAGNVSFNAYLIYFTAVSLSVFLIGRDISVRDIIPLNMIGLFVGISTLWGLSNTKNINAVNSENFFTGEFFTAMMFTLLVVFSILSVLFSAKKFSEKDDGYLSLGYIAPVIWFIFNINNLNSLNDIVIGSFYVIISVACFAGWHSLTATNLKFQHTSLYSAGLITAFLAIFSVFEEFNVFTSILIAYSSLIFAFLFLMGAGKSERFISYVVVSLAGSVLSLQHILEANLSYQTFLVVIALIPAMSTYFVAKHGSKPEFVAGSKAYSIVWSLVALMFIISEFIEYVDISFLLFYLVPLLFLGYLGYISTVSPNIDTHDSRSQMLRSVMIWFGFGFSSVFFTLIVNLYPAPTDVYLFSHPNVPTDWIMIKGIFATVILFMGLYISRALQLEQVIKRPSFLLVIFGFSTLLLTGNYIISAIANDLQVSLAQGGPRAIATTLWWVAIAIYMLYKGIKLGKKYHAEKLLGLTLLGITLLKVVLYDIATMGMQNKIIVLMLVGGAMLLFSYRVRSKNLLGTSEPH